jgi:hypothetical protein
MSFLPECRDCRCAHPLVALITYGRELGKIVSCGAKKTNPTLALGMRKDGALRRLAGLMNLVATNLGVVDLFVLTRFVPQGQFDSVPQS